MGILLIFGIIFFFYIGPKFIWGFEAAYRRKLDNMNDSSLINERNYLISKINAGTSFEKRRSYGVKIDKLCIVERKLKLRGYKLT